MAIALLRCVDDDEPTASVSSTRSASYEAARNGLAPPKPFRDLYVGHISAVKATMSILAHQLGGFSSDRVVLDRTGITGEFNYELFFAPNGHVPDGKLPLTRPLAGVLEEELGLQLKPSVEPVEFIVIESVERPTPN